MLENTSLKLLLQNLPFAAECELKPTSHTNSPANMYKHEPAYVLPSAFDMSQPPPGYKPLYDPQTANEETMESEVEFVDHQDNGDVEVINRWSFSLNFIFMFRCCRSSTWTTPTRRASPRKTTGTAGAEGADRETDRATETEDHADRAPGHARAEEDLDHGIGNATANERGRRNAIGKRIGNGENEVYRRLKKNT